MAAQTDFWGEIQAEDIRTPVSILREQAALLGPKTQNVIEAKVDTSTEGVDFYHSFYLVAPALENYHYRLFRVTHPIELYPLRVTGLPAPLVSEDEFRGWLREKLSSDETKRIIANLLAQARG